MSRSAACASVLRVRCGCVGRWRCGGGGGGGGSDSGASGPGDEKKVTLRSIKNLRDARGSRELQAERTDWLLDRHWTRGGLLDQLVPKCLSPRSRLGLIPRNFSRRAMRCCRTPLQPASPVSRREDVSGLKTTINSLTVIIMNWRAFAFFLKLCVKQSLNRSDACQSLTPGHGAIYFRFAWLLSPCSSRSERGGLVWDYGTPRGACSCGGRWRRQRDRRWVPDPFYNEFRNTWARPAAVERTGRTRAIALSCKVCGSCGFSPPKPRKIVCSLVERMLVEQSSCSVYTLSRHAECLHGDTADMNDGRTGRFNRNAKACRVLRLAVHLRVTLEPPGCASAVLGAAMTDR